MPEPPAASGPAAANELERFPEPRGSLLLELLFELLLELPLELLELLPPRDTLRLAGTELLELLPPRASLRLAGTARATELPKINGSTASTRFPTLGSLK